MIDPNDLDGRTVCFLNFATGNAMTLDTQVDDPSDGTKVHSWVLNGNNNQVWKLKIVDGKGTETPTFVIGNKRAPGKFLDLYHGSSSNNTKITGWAGGTEGNYHQLWNIQTRGNWADKGQIVKIQNYNAGTFVDLHNGGSSNG
ncbi:carbohydrate-binding module family 13 [Fusarium sp. NRRL 52700]|nr:carbohydrate-binding module family 13 [Fusarium sp. NRRL 52700]